MLRNRMDLCLRYGDITLGIELKVQRDRGPNQLKAGLEQIEGYLEGLSLDSGWLVIFDRRQEAPSIAERTRTEHHQSPKGLNIMVIFG